MQKYPEVKEFKLTQEPIIKSNIIIIHAVDNTHAKQKCIYFPGYRDAQDTAVIKALKANETVFLEGMFKPDRRTNEMQFTIERVSHTKQEQSVISGPVDIPGDISPTRQVQDNLAERRLEVKKYTFPDGSFFYSDGIEFWSEKGGPREKLTRSFIEHYNNNTTMLHWLLPDWYTAGKELRDLL